MKKFVTVLLIVVLVLGSIFVYGGDEEGENGIAGIEPTEVLSVVEEVD